MALMTRMALMNPIREIESLKAARGIALKPAFVHLALNHPVFDAAPRQLNPDELEWVRRHLRNPETLLPSAFPFPCFRIRHHPSAGDGFRQWFVAPDHRAMSCFEVKRVKDSEFWMLMNYLPGRKKPSSVAAESYRIEGHCWRDGIHVAPELDALTETERKEYAEALHEPLVELWAFLFDVFSLANAVLRVEPKAGETKPVEWRLARTHYLILHKRSAASMRDRRRAASDRDIVRAAHFRRAHLRRLMSGRYTRKKGTLVQVREAWVGPKEWVGLDQKIYSLQTVTPTVPQS